MFMKAMNLSRTAIRCGAGLALLLGLAVGRPVSAQPVPLSYFQRPTANFYVRITSPANHATFYTPVDIPIFAFAREEVLSPAVNDVEYTNVDFYAGTNYLGAGFCLSSNNPPKAFPLQAYAVKPLPRLGAMYCLVWTNAPAGSYALTAVARGRDVIQSTGLSRTSAPVNITILASLTNQNVPDVASITATDPIAVAGTNACWVWPGITNATPAWTNWPPAHWGYTTNWGPKNALFTVRRFGNADTNLTVNYSIGGTASNGVDYVELPGSVTVPAGEAYALIPVVPIDNSVTNFSKTVILSLTADTNTPPDYTVGVPARAEALIMDYWPRPRPWLLADRTFHVNTNGPDGAWFYIQNSGDLKHWTPVSTNQIVHGSLDFIDPEAPGNSVRFYQAVPLTNPPAD
jgi:hypothetical protein